MSAAERVRQLLDERGVEWGATDTHRLLVTSWNDSSGHSWAFTEHRDGSFSKLTAYHLTPEQAIAATLGRGNAGRYVGLRQGEYWERTENSDYYCGGCGWKVTDHDSYCPECGGALHKATLGSCNCSNSERTNETCLPHFWTHDGTLHVELPKLPESISVRLPAQHDREVGSARVWQYTRGSGTCKIHDCEGSFSAVNRPVWRCDCGAFMTQYTDATTYHKPRFCPNCGRKVVDK